MKLSILGGGGFRVPYVYQALLRDRGTPRIEEVSLYDVDTGRLDSMTRVLAELAQGHPDAPKVTATTVLDDAVHGSDFVFAAIRVGGLVGRTCDERVALDLDVLGQETTGPGGIAYGLRTVPVMLDIARRVRELAPHAWVINFTNPAGMITEAMQTVLGDRVLGICDTPSGMGRRLAGALGVDPGQVEFDYVGLNHLGWMRAVRHEGRDLLPGLLADDAALGALEEGMVFGREWLRDLGLIPNEYLYYYYFTRDAVRAVVDAGRTRGEFLVEQQTAFFDRLARETGPGAVGLWRQTVAGRSASYMAEAKGGAHPGPADGQDDEPQDDGYARVAVGVMAAIARNEPARMILNVRNGTTVAALPEDAVVEVPVTVDAAGVHPLRVAPPDLHQAGLMQQVKAVERLTISAAATGSPTDAVKAFALHPLVDSVTVGRALFEGYTRRIPQVGAVFKR